MTLTTTPAPTVDLDSNVDPNRATLIATESGVVVVLHPDCSPALLDALDRSVVDAYRSALASEGLDDGLHASEADIAEVLDAFGRRLLAASGFDVDRAKRMAKIAAVAAVDEIDAIDGDGR